MRIGTGPAGEGAAMNAKFPDGTTLICRKMEEPDTWLPHDAFVIIEREAHGLREYSCKQVERIEGGTILLHNRSTEEQFAEPIALGEGIKILGRVVRAYQDFEAI